MHTNETDICNSLSTLELDFYSALQNNLNDLVSFQESWSTFSSNVDTCADLLHEETKLRISTFVSGAERIATLLLDVQATSETLSHQLEEDITKMVEEHLPNLSITDAVAPPSDTPNSPYIPAAYKWLLENLHNPYPSKDTRLAISTSTNSSLKDIDAWFIDARKRIGWNQLRKDHFPKRGDLIKAATQFFKPSPSILSPPTPFLRRVSDSHDCSNEFAKIEALAQLLYSSKLFPTSLVSQIEIPANQSGMQSSSTIKQQRDRTVDHRFSYPSPAYSPDRSPSPALSLSTSSTDTFSRKRSRSATEPESDDEQPNSRVAKRKRYSAPEIRDNSIIIPLPSPPISISELAADELSTDFGPPVAAISPIQPSTKRKHSVSDVDHHPSKLPNNNILVTECSAEKSPSNAIQDTTSRASEKRKRSFSDHDDHPRKRPSNSSQLVQRQVVSDPISLSSYLTTQSQPTPDTWLDEILSSHHHITHEIPAPVVAESYDDFSEFEVDYYKYDFSAYPSHVVPPNECPELSNETFLSHSHLSAISDDWNGDAATTPKSNPEQAESVPSFSWEFHSPSMSHMSNESWHSDLLTDILSPNWTSDALSIENVLRQCASPLSSISGQSIDPVDVSIISPIVMPSVSAPPTQDPKSLKLQHYHKLLAEAQMLRAELSL